MGAQYSAQHPGTATPLAHSVAPIGHDYINTKGICLCMCCVCLCMSVYVLCMSVYVLCMYVYVCVCLCMCCVCLCMSVYVCMYYVCTMYILC